MVTSYAIGGQGVFLQRLGHTSSFLDLVVFLSYFLRLLLLHLIVALDEVHSSRYPCPIPVLFTTFRTTYPDSDSGVLSLLAAETEPSSPPRRSTNSHSFNSFVAVLFFLFCSSFAPDQSISCLRFRYVGSSCLASFRGPRLTRVEDPFRRVASQLSPLPACFASSDHLATVKDNKKSKRKKNIRDTLS